MINIREAKITDLNALREIGRQTYREHFSDIWSFAGMSDFLDQDFSPSALEKSLNSLNQIWLVVADEGGKVVGFSKINLSKPAPISGEVGVELQKIYFLKSEAGRGYGKQLLNYIYELGTKRGESLVWLDVLKTNLSARRFYSSLGFQERGEIPFKTDIVEIGMVVMVCPLSNSMQPHRAAISSQD
ncbi:GNAT family N-acetyltransferase [Janthinobacterium sp.]|uniref:GNAT family N-acetyltransferase n=1 Tax=Janthinobacterium sp. TaxID=1871054 RepID=UPI00293D3B58|nr:GNAT family N-acetyltransferase [Janthinobacterium sp.]